LTSGEAAAVSTFSVGKGPNVSEHALPIACPPNESVMGGPL